MARDEMAAWHDLLAAERRLQQLIPDTILVGGTAAALHAHHRLSLDGDHVLPDLTLRFEQVLAVLEADPGWQTARIQKPVLILGTLDGAQTGLRQLRRQQPLQIETVEGLRIPTLAEMARIKCWLLLERDTTRDYLDAVVLLETLGESRALAAMRPFDQLYPRGPARGPTLAELVDRLARAQPKDRTEVDLSSYKGVVAPWNSWPHLENRGRHWAGRLAAALLGDRGP